MQKNIIQVIMLLVIILLSACQSDSADAKSSSRDIKEIYSNSSTLDETIPKSVSIVAGESISFSTKGNFIFHGKGQYLGNYYSWNTLKNEVGQYIITFFDNENREQNVTINVTSIVKTPTITASQGEYSDRVNININTDVNYYNTHLFYSPIKDGTYISLEGNQHILNSSATILDYFYKVQIVDENGNYSLKSKPVKGYFASPTPSNITTSLDNKIGTVNLAWSIAYPNLENLTYNIFRDKNCDNIIDEIITGITTNSYRDENLTLGDNYCYKISSVVNNRESQRSYSSYSLDMKVPKPQNIVFTTTINSATLSWDKVVGVDRYKVYRSSSRYGNFSLLASLIDTKYTDKSVNFNEIKYYKVVAVKDNIESDSDNRLEVHILPAYPKNFTASQGTYSDMIKLSWSKNSNVDSYTLYRATEINGYYTTLEQNIVPNIEKYVDIDADINTTYFYKIVSVYNNQKGDDSKIELGYYGDTVYDGMQLKSKVPYNLKIENGILSWNKAENIITYNIYSSTSKDGNFSLDGSSSTLSYTPNNDKQFFYLKGVKADGTLTRATQVIYYIPISPTVVNINSNVDEVYLDWNSTNATSYNIYKEIDSEYTLINTVQTTRYTDINVTYSERCKYKITANFLTETSDVAQTSYISEYVKVQEPSNLVASNGQYSDRVILNWSANDKADSYSLYRATSINGSYSQIVNSQNITRFEDSSVSMETVYYYKIRSVYNNSYGDYADIVTGSFGSTQLISTFSASINTPRGIAFDSHNNLYALDYNYNTIYKITPNGEKTIFVSDINYPYDIAIDSKDNIYISENSNNQVYKVTLTGEEIALNIDLGEPKGLAIDSEDSLYIVDYSYNKVHKIDTEGSISTFKTALNSPKAITIDSLDNVYISDSVNDKIYRYKSDGTDETEFVSGVSGVGYITVNSNNFYISADGDNSLYKVDNFENREKIASYSTPTGIAFDSENNLYIADDYNNDIYKYTIIKSTVPYNVVLNDTTLSWSKTDDAISYEVFSSSSEDGTYSVLKDSIEALSYELDSTGEYYKIRAKFLDGSYSNLTYAVH